MAYTPILLEYLFKSISMSTGRKIRKLYETRDLLQMELEDLHMSEPSETWYKINRHELESKIAMIEDVIHELEQEQKMMRPFFWTTVGFAIVAFGLLIYAYVKSKT